MDEIEIDFEPTNKYWNITKEQAVAGAVNALAGMAVVAAASFLGTKIHERRALKAAQKLSEENTEKV